ncbi:MAG: hypothetical protein WC859_00840 [Elusimicrobiota bacterium]
MKTPLHQAKWNVLSVYFAATVLYIAYWTRYYTGYFGDDAAFISGAQSLLQGSFRALYLFDKPPQTHFLPGFPLALSPLILWVSPTSPVLKLLPMAFTLLSILLMDRLIRPWLSGAFRLLALSLFALHPVTGMYATSLMSEPFFTFLVLASFVLLTKAIESDHAAGGWYVGAALAWTMLTRPIGALIWPSAAAGLILARRWKAFVTGTTVSAALWAAFAIRNVAVSNSASNYLRYWHDDFFSNTGILHVFQNAFHVYLQIVVAHLLQLAVWHRTYGTGLAAVIIAVWILVSLAGIRACARRAPDHRPLLAALAVFTFSYLAVHGVWSVFEDRYILPLLPFLILFLVSGLEFLFAPLGRRQALTATCALLLPGLLATNIFYVRQTWSSNQPAESRPPLETMNWIQQKVQPEDLVCIRAPATLFLFTGRAGISVPVVQDPEELHFLLSRIRARFIVSQKGGLASLSNDSRANQQANEDRIKEWLRREPDKFQPVYENAEEGTRIYRMEHL